VLNKLEMVPQQPTPHLTLADAVPLG
jgi:hypothetical protein